MLELSGNNLPHFTPTNFQFQKFFPIIFNMV